MPPKKASSSIAKSANMTPEDPEEPGVGLEDVVLEVEHAPRNVVKPRSQCGKTGSWGPDRTHSHQTKQAAVGDNPRTTSPQREQFGALSGKQQSMITYSSQRSYKKFEPLENNKNTPHKKGAQLFGKIHDRNKGDHQHTPYSRRSKREKTGTPWL